MPFCALERVIYLGSPEWDTLAGTGRAATAGRSAYRDALAERAAALSFDDPINIQYTSGTTGFPKGATLPHHNILNNGFFMRGQSIAELGLAEAAPR